MPRYGTGALYGDAHLYGTSVGVLTTDEDAVAGQTPALPDRRVPWRAACAEVWTFDPITWSIVDKLEHVSDTATRSISLSDLGRQTETLTFDLFPPLAADLLEGDWVSLQWTVANPDNSTSYRGGVFRISNAPNIDRDASGILYHVAAIDWWAYTAQSEISSSGWLLASTFTGSSKPEQLVNYLEGYLTDQGWSVPVSWEPWSDFGPDASPPDTGPFTQITTPGTPSRITDLLAWFWPKTGGYQLVYLPSGGLLVRGKTPVDSGCYITDDTAVLGSVPLPWETVQRAYRIPDALTVQYFLNNTDGANIYFREARAATDHDFGISTIERIVDVGNAVTLAGFPDGADFCTYRLIHQHLGPADMLAVVLDSAFPPPAMGTLVAVHILPTGASSNSIAGHYRLTGWTQPVGVGSASMTAEWWSAL